jgi:hypothetical protein
LVNWQILSNYKNMDSCNWFYTLWTHCHVLFFCATLYLPWVFSRHMDLNVLSVVITNTDSINLFLSEILAYFFIYWDTEYAHISYISQNSMLKKRIRHERTKKLIKVYHPHWKLQNHTEVYIGKWNWCTIFQRKVNTSAFPFHSNLYSF